MQDYPTRIESETGEHVWLTRFPESDARAASAYEGQYARWVPGDPLEALIAVFVLMPDNGRPEF